MESIIDLLKKSYTSDNETEVLECLIRLRPDRLSTDELAMLVKYVECVCHTDAYDYEHYNIIGTGGDQFKTINLSSFAAIIASRYVDVVKMGARGITSLWGSRDFNSIITSRKENANNKYYFTNSRSRFLSFGELGIQYGDTLVKARRKLYESTYLDIYKVIFPFANVTSCSGQVNGVSNEKYHSMFVDLSLLFNRHTIIVRSYLGVDELMPGENQYTVVKDGKIHDRSLSVPSNDIEFFSESGDTELLFSRFKSVIDQTASKDVMTTIYYNVASIIHLREHNSTLEAVLDSYFS